MDDIAEAYLEAFRKLGIVVGVEIDNSTKYYSILDAEVRTEAIEFHHILLDAAEDEGWDIEEMEGL